MLSTTDCPAPEHLVEHWRWRPEWTPGRVCVWWYLTFEDHPVVAALAGAVGEQISGSVNVDLVPSEWLHLSLGEVGFADELPSGELGGVIDQARAALWSVGSFILRVGPVATLPGAVVLQAHSGTGVEQLRRHLPRRSPGSVPSAVPWPGPEEVEPHLSVAYINTHCEREDVMGHLTSEALPVSLRVEAVVLAAVTRRARHYEWTRLDVIPLAGLPSSGAQTGSS